MFSSILTSFHHSIVARQHQPHSLAASELAGLTCFQQLHPARFYHSLSMLNRSDSFSQFNNLTIKRFNNPIQQFNSSTLQRFNALSTPEQKKPRIAPELFSFKVGGDLLFRLRSTIGADRLNFSVRNGKRWNPVAITTLRSFRHFLLQRSSFVVGRSSLVVRRWSSDIF